MHRNGSASTLLKYRLVIAVLIFIILYNYFANSRYIYDLIEDKKSQIEYCRATADSYFAKLQVVWSHKKKMEQISEQKSNISEKLNAELRESLTKCSLKIISLNATIKMLEEKREAVVTNGSIIHSDVANENLKVELEELNERLKRLETELEKIRGEKVTIQNDLNDCRQKVDSLAGPAAVLHYAGNGSATFNRKHKAAEELSFDRGNIQQPRMQLVPAGEVMKRIEEAEERKNVHPDDRESKDDYAHEEPDKEEKDYKEGVQVV